MPKMGLECARAGTQTQVWWPPGLVLFPPHLRTPCSPGHSSHVGHRLPLPALLGNSGILEQGWVRDRRGVAISIEPSVSQTLPGSPAPQKAECLTTRIFSPGRDGKGELPQGDFKGRWRCSLCSCQRETPSSWLRWGIPLDFIGFKRGAYCFPIV